MYTLVSTCDTVALLHVLRGCPDELGSRISVRSHHSPPRRNRKSQKYSFELVRHVCVTLQNFVGVFRVSRVQRLALLVFVRCSTLPPNTGKEYPQPNSVMGSSGDSCLRWGGLHSRLSMRLNRIALMETPVYSLYIHLAHRPCICFQFHVDLDDLHFHQ